MAKEKFVNEFWDDLVDSFSNIRTGTNMPRYLLPNMPCLFGRNLQVCDSCCVKLTLFKRKALCSQCQKIFCSRCVSTGVSTDKQMVLCRICVVLLMRPPDKQLLLTLRVKDLQRFLTAHHVSTHGCVEKEDLVNLLLVYTNGKPTYGTSSSSTPDASSFVIPDEVGIEAGIDAAINGRIDAGESTNFADGASTSFSSSAPPTDTTRTEFGVAVSRTTEDESRNGENRSGETAEESETSVDPALGADQAGASCALVTVTYEDASVSPPPGPSCSTEPSFSNSHLEPSTSINSEILSIERNASPPGSPNLSQTDSATGSPIFVRPSMAAIQSKEDMEQMSVKQLKCLLARHRVDYHGCCEKAELVERASRLWRDYKAARADLDNLDLDELCKVCMDAPIECVMLECGHMATCTDCGRQLCECPICRQYVVRIVRTFRA